MLKQFLNKEREKDIHKKPRQRNYRGKKFTEPVNSLFARILIYYWRITTYPIRWNWDKLLILDLFLG